MKINRKIISRNRNFEEQMVGVLLENIIQRREKEKRDKKNSKIGF